MNFFRTRIFNIRKSVSGRRESAVNYIDLAYNLHIVIHVKYITALICNSMHAFLYIIYLADGRYNPRNKITPSFIVLLWTAYAWLVQDRPPIIRPRRFCIFCVPYIKKLALQSKESISIAEK